MKVFRLLVMIFVCIPLSAALADVPQMLNYQGYVETTTGVPINGPGFFKFAIVNQAGNITYWSNDGSSTIGNEPTDAVEIPMTNGNFTLKLGDPDLANMNVLDTTPFEEENIYVRVWFSESGSSFQQLAPDTRIASVGFAFKAQSVVEAPSVDWSDILNRPEGLDDGDQVGITEESDPLVNANVKDGVDWSEITNRPAGLDDGDDVASGGVAWTDITGIPADIANGDDVGISVESDPQVGTLTNGRWCTSNGSQVNCTSTPPSSPWTQSGSNIYYNTGNVGVGLSNPTERLHINGNIIADDIKAYGLTGRSAILNIDTPGDLEISLEPVNNTSMFSFFEIFKTGSHIFWINEDGNGWIKGTITENSDRRLKENIVPVENALEKISSISGIYYNDKNKSESPIERKVGVIAQDVEAVLPEAVSENLDGYKSVAYSRLTPLLIEAIKELKSENENLKARLTALEEMIRP